VLLGYIVIVACYIVTVGDLYVLLLLFLYYSLFSVRWSWVCALPWVFCVRLSSVFLSFYLSTKLWRLKIHTILFDTHNQDDPPEHYINIWADNSLVNTLHTKNQIQLSENACTLLHSLRYLRTALFWVITQRVVSISYRRSGTTYRSYLQGPCGWDRQGYHETSVRKYHYIPIYIQQDATLHSLFISGNYNVSGGTSPHPSSGAHTTVPKAPVICHTVTATYR
jgi:hypothetical protein